MTGLSSTSKNADEEVVPVEGTDAFSEAAPLPPRLEDLLLRLLDIVTRNCSSKGEFLCAKIRKRQARNQFSVHLEGKFLKPRRGSKDHNVLGRIMVFETRIFVC